MSIISSENYILKTEYIKSSVGLFYIKMENKEINGTL